jgi:hypothetical protein
MKPAAFQSGSRTIWSISRSEISLHCMVVRRGGGRFRADALGRLGGWAVGGLVGA